MNPDQTETNHTSANDPIPATPMRFVFFALRPIRTLIGAIILVVTIAALLNNAVPYLFKLIIDAATEGNTDLFVQLTIAYPVLLAVAYVLWRSSGFLGSYAFTKAEAYSYNRLFDHLVRHSDAYFSSRFAGTVAAKVNRAASHTESILEELTWHYYTSLLQFAVVVVLTMVTNVWIGFAFLVAVVVIIIVNVYLVRRRRPLVVAAAQAHSNLAGATVDTVTNIRAVQQFARLPFELARIGTKIETTRVLALRQWRSAELGLVINNVIIVALIAVVVYLLASLWLSEQITTGDVVMVLTLLSSIIGTLTFIGAAMNKFIRHYGEVQEGLEQILAPHGMQDERGAAELEVSEGAIFIHNVEFSYPESSKEPVFLDLDLMIPAGQRVGLVGASGAGKSSLVSLLLRQHDITDGEILIDGQNINHVTMDSVRRAIAFVPQDPLLFHRSLRENIAYGNPEATEEEVLSAAQKAQAHEFILETPEQYETLVGERGIKLSGGQRQRIAIARAILKNAPILILDEATSALDSESEVLIQKALHELMLGKTVIAIAHRLSTLREMDRLIVLEKGKIVQDGSHEELVRQEGVYRRLWEHQAGGFLQE